MKIKVKKTSWSGWNEGSSEETNYEYNIETKQTIVVDSMECSTYENGKENFSNEIIFSFKVMKITDQYLILTTYGTAGGICYKGKSKPRKIVLKFNESITFKTNFMDAGKNFEITIG